MRITFENIAIKAQEIINSGFTSTTEEISKDYSSEFAKHGLTLTFEENELVAWATRVNKLKRAVTVFAVRFRTIESRNNYLNKQLAAFENKIQQKEIEKTIKQTTKNPFNVGDVLNHSFGYSMTLNNYFQVIEVKGMNLVLREICSEILTGDGYSGQERAIKDCFKNETLISKRVQVRVYGSDISFIIKYDNGNLKLANTEKGEYYNKMD